MKAISCDGLLLPLKEGTKQILESYHAYGNKYNLTAKQGDNLIIDIESDDIVITYSCVSEYFRALGIVLSCDSICHVEQKRSFKDLSYMLDVSRNGVMNVESIKKTIRFLALLGYNSIQLYTEDTYEIDGEPYFGYLRGGLNQSELSCINSYAQLFGIELIPCIQTLGHLSRLFRWPRYWPVCEGYDVLMPEEQATYTLLDKMFASLRKCFTTNRVNICMDEVASLGKCAYWDKNGCPKDYLNIFVTHLNKVNEIACKYGFDSPMMWGDMFLKIENDYQVEIGKKPVRQEIKNKIPQNVTIIDWCYHVPDYIRDVLDSFLSFNRHIAFAGGILRFCSFSPNNGESISRLSKQIDVCNDAGIDQFIVTAWGDHGSECSFFSAMPSLFAVAEKSFNCDYIAEKEKFSKLFGCDFDDMMKLDLVNKYTNSEKISNKSSYLLYSNYFSCTLASQLPDCDSNMYAKYEKELVKASKHAGQWKYLFDTHIALCKILGLKHNLYKATQQAYLNKDKNALAVLVSDRYKKLAKLISAFENTLEKQWMIENKPHGFDALAQRLGGLLFCTNDVIDTLQQYIKGKINCIMQLEEKLLSFQDNVDTIGLPVFGITPEIAFTSYKA